jgi:hypothetical protein
MKLALSWLDLAQPLQLDNDREEKDETSLSIFQCIEEVNDHPQIGWLDRYASLQPRRLRRGEGELSEIDSFLSGKPCPLGREASTFGHRPKRQKHVSALNGALATGCGAPGL